MCSVIPRGRFAWRRIRTFIRPRVRLLRAPEMTIDWDVPVTVRDGTVLRVNVFRPAGQRPVAVILSAHPYGKDRIPRRTRSGRRLNPQYRLFPQPGMIRISDLAGWEAPDPAFWVGHGYAVVNADLRGAGTSAGTGDFFTDSEARDYYDLIEWAGTQPWSTGKVGLHGVSYLAISQYRAAALRPPHLAAICPWEGFSDIYRDFARPGGVREDGFSIMWSAMTRLTCRVAGNLRKEFVARPERDAWYADRTPDLAAIEVPMLVCATFSDQSLHSRGSFEAFRRTGSSRKWLYTHRDGKWSHFYSPGAAAEQLRFFDHVLRDEPNGWQDRPAVRIAVHEAGPDPAEIWMTDQWPPSGLDWQTLYLDAASAGMLAEPAGPAQAVFSTSSESVTWTWRVPYDLDVIGPMAARLRVSVQESDDAHLLAAVRKFRAGREVFFEGSYGYSLDVVSRGWLRLAHRDLDEDLSQPWQPVGRHDSVRPVRSGEIVEASIALLPQATRFRAGDELRLELRGRWLFPRNPLTGQFPAGYQRGPGARVTVHTGGDSPSGLLLGIRRL